MALYFDTYICPDTNIHCKIMNPVPENTPAIRAFLIFTLVLGISLNMAAKNSHVNLYDAHFNANEITGDINSNLNKLCRVDVINSVNPLAQVNNTGRMSNIAV